MLSPSNNIQVKLKNISYHSKAILSKIEFQIHLTMIYRVWHDKISLFIHFEDAGRILASLNVFIFSCQNVSFPLVNPYRNQQILR